MNHSQTEDRQQRQTALYSFYGAIGVGILVVGFWWLTRPDPNTVAMQRRINSMTLSWRCPQGHTFEHQGSTHRVGCPECKRLADISVTYICPRHGERPALIRLTRDGDGRERVSEVSFRHGVWRTVARDIRCPQCGLKMTPKTPDPFAVPAPSMEEGR